MYLMAFANMKPAVIETNATNATVVSTNSFMTTF